MPISRGEAFNINAAVNGNARNVTCPPKCVIVSEIHSVRKSRLRQSLPKYLSNRCSCVVIFILSRLVAQITLRITGSRRSQDDGEILFRFTFPAVYFRRGPYRKALPDYVNAMPASADRRSGGRSKCPSRTPATMPLAAATGRAHIAK